jgi:hypothetical protein
MKTPEAELKTLSRRYRRVLGFDRTLCAIYCVTAGVPLYGLLTRPETGAFHTIAALVILAVGIAGVLIDTRMLQRKIASEWPAYAVTLGFVLSRAVLFVWAISIVRTRIADSAVLQMPGSGESGSPMPMSEAIVAALEFLFSPPLVWVGFLAAFYRLLYHISVHFFLRLPQGRTSPASPFALNGNGPGPTLAATSNQHVPIKH